MEADWRRIETAPKDGRSLLLYIADFGADWPPYMIVGYYRDGFWWDADGYGYQKCVTHWMALPAPPAH